MSGNLRFSIGLGCGLVIGCLPLALMHLHAATHVGHDPGTPDTHGARASDTRLHQPRAHSQEKFSFPANAPIDQVFPLFGADKERVWAPGWNPQFVQPLPAADVHGMVFSVAHGPLNSIWINTEFDRELGRVQYVYMIPDHLVTLITLRVQPDGNHTKVDVEYQRTALTPDADAHVEEMAKQDRAAGPEWEKQINDWLVKKPGPA